MLLKASEISEILKEEIKSFVDHSNIEETGRVISVGDGVARVYGLENIKAGEMIEFENGSRGIALNLEQDNVGCVIFGDDIEIVEGEVVKRTN